MKKNIFLRIIALALCALMLVCTFSCTNNNNNEEENAGNEESSVPEVALTENDKTVVMTVGGNDVSLALYRYYFMNYKAMSDGGDETVWASNPELAEQVKKMAIDNIKYQFAGEALCKDYGLEISKDELEAYMEEFMTSEIENYGGYEAYVAELDAYYLTDKVYRGLNEATFAQVTLYNYLYGEGGVKEEIADEDILEYVKENYVRAKHILVKTEGLTDEEKAAKLTDAQSLLDRIDAGEDFDELRSAHSEDPGQTDIGYYFTTGMMVQEFEDAAYALKIGETSDIVETDYGYHIIRRLEMEDEHILADDTIKAQSSLYISYEKFYEEIMSKADALEVTYVDNFDSYTAETLK